jgi:hypothetical protein
MIGLIITIAVVGFLIWLLITYVPMPAPFPAVIIFIAVLLLLLMVFGGGNFGNIGSFGCGAGSGLFHR